MYNDIAPISTTAGLNLGGLASFRFVPREWLAGEISIDPLTGAVIAAPALLPGKDWLSASCADSSMEYAEKDSTEKGGAFIEALLTGVVYKDELERHVAMATLRFHEFVVIYSDANRKRRIIGNRKKGMSFLADFRTGKDRADATMFTITFTHQLEEPAPAYTGV